MKASVKVILATVAIVAILAGCGAQPASTTPSSEAAKREEASIVSSAPVQESSAQEQAQSEAPKEKQVREVDEVPQGSGNQSLLQMKLKERGPDFIEVELDPFFVDIEGDIFIQLLVDGKPIREDGKWTNQLRQEGLPTNTRILVMAQREGIEGKYSASNVAAVETGTLKEYQTEPVHAVFTYDGNKISITPSDSEKLMAIKLLREGDKFTIPEGGHETRAGYGSSLIPVENFVGPHAEAAGLKERGFVGIALIARDDNNHEARWCEAIINIDDLIAKGTIDTRDLVGAQTP